MTVKRFMLAGLMLLLTPIVFAEEISQADVYQSAAELHAEVETIRVAMGRPKHQLEAASDWKIENASPRHLYYVAQIAYGRANRLAETLAGAAPRRAAVLATDNIDNEAVLIAIGQVNARLQLVKRSLGLSSSSFAVQSAGNKDLNDALAVLGDAGRELDLLLGHAVEWSEIYDRVALAMSYVAGALPADEQYPVLPAFESAKFAPDVFMRMRDCVDAARKPARKAGVKVLDSGPVNAKKVLPLLDELAVFDGLTLLVADLAEYSLEIDAPDGDPLPYPRPQNILPSHVYQLLGALEAQLKALD